MFSGHEDCELWMGFRCKEHVHLSFANSNMPAHKTTALPVVRRQSPTCLANQVSQMFAVSRKPKGCIGRLSHEAVTAGCHHQMVTSKALSPGRRNVARRRSWTTQTWSSSMRPSRIMESPREFGCGLYELGSQFGSCYMPRRLTPCVFQQSDGLSS
jgi:hypothetical protein